eukprot:364003-Chlamydomonas_euryale.AAC.37
MGAAPTNTRLGRDAAHSCCTLATVLPRYSTCTRSVHESRCVRVRTSATVCGMCMHPHLVQCKESSDDKPRRLLRRDGEFGQRPHGDHLVALAYNHARGLSIFLRAQEAPAEADRERVEGAGACGGRRQYVQQHSPMRTRCRQEC